MTFQSSSATSPYLALAFFSCTTRDNPASSIARSYEVSVSKLSNNASIWEVVVVIQRCCVLYRRCPH